MSRFSRIFQFQVRSSYKGDLTMVLWSRNYSVKSNRKLENPSDEGPIKFLQNKIDTGELKIDEHQTRVMNELQKLYDTIQTYSPPEIQSKSSFLKWLPIRSSKAGSNNAPKGLYIYGSVGGGKTTLMDLFYNSCQSVRFNAFLSVLLILFLKWTMMTIFLQISRKKRIHFNSFMTDVHARIHAVKEEESKNLKYVGSDKANPFDPTRPVAEMISKNTWLLCFDEFQVCSFEKK